MTEAADKRREVDRNFEAIKKKLPELLESHAGKFALMRHGDVVEFFDTARDAMLYGTREFEDGLFSVQEISDKAVNLGYFSYAMHNGAVRSPEGTDR